MKTNQLVEIPPSDWQKLADLYRGRTTDPSGWNCIHNYINWVQRDSTIDNVKFYSLNGDWRDGTFLIQDDISIMFNTLEQSQDRVLQALQCFESLKQLPGVEYICLCDFAHRFKTTIDRYLEPTGIEVDVTAIWLHISRNKALQFNVCPPPGTVLKALDHSHIDVVNSFWTYRYPGSELYIDRLIRLNISFGLFDENGDLLGWCLQQPRGGLGLLQVLEHHKRKGYGSLIVRAMCRKLAETGIEVTTSVLDVNVASRKMFAKIGFKEIDSIHWVCKPLPKTSS